MILGMSEMIESIKLQKCSFVEADSVSVTYMSGTLHFGSGNVKVDIVVSGAMKISLSELYMSMKSIMDEYGFRIIEVEQLHVIDRGTYYFTYYMESR